MNKYRVTWWETNKWETWVEANSPEEAVEKVKNNEDDALEHAKETDDSFIESGDFKAEEYKGENKFIENFKKAAEELDINYTIIHMEKDKTGFEIKKDNDE